MSVFKDWCVFQGVPSLPAAPAHVAKFISDIAELGIEKIWPIVEEIARAHYVQGLADPTLGGWVAAAINGVSKLEAPRSWPAEHKASFGRLPYDLQKFLAAEERRQAGVVRAAMQVAADARKAAELPKLPKNFYRNAGKKADGNSSHPAA